MTKTEAVPPEQQALRNSYNSANTSRDSEPQTMSRPFVTQRFAAPGLAKSLVVQQMEIIAPGGGYLWLQHAGRRLSAIRRERHSCLSLI